MATSSMRTRLVLLPLFLVLLSTALSGCSTVRQKASRYPSPDLEAIYRQALPNPDRSPVLLVHGFGGAKLTRDGDGAVAWGEFFTGKTLLPSREQGLRALALDVAALPDPPSHVDLRVIDDDSSAAELLEHVEADAKVVDIQFGVYAAIVEMLEKAGYGPCVHDPAEAVWTERPPCLIFHYDFRQDNVGSALALARYIERARKQLSAVRPEGATEPVRFDLLAHSMGGLISRYYLRYGARDVLDEKEPLIDWAGAEPIERLFVISTPNFGAMRVLRDLIRGQRYPVVSFEPTLLATFVSMYQMLPREIHRLWLTESGEAQGLEYMSSQFWSRHRWGAFADGQDRYLERLYPDTDSPAERLERLARFMDAAFERAKRFHAALDRHPPGPPPTELIMFTGDAEPTPTRAQLVTTKDAALELRFGGKASATNEKLASPGDGTVPRSSAIADERLGTQSPGWLTSPIPWDRTIFLSDSHRTFMGNPTFQSNLLHLLLETQPKPRRPPQ